MSEKEKCKKDGTNTRTSGVIPFIQLGEINPGEFMVFYQSLLPDGEDGKGWLFPKARAVSGKFNPHDPLSDLYETKQKVGAVEGATGILNSILSSDLEITAKYECHTENSVQRVEVSTVFMFSINCSLYYWQVSSKPSQQS